MFLIVCCPVAGQRACTDLSEAVAAADKDMALRRGMNRERPICGMAAAFGDTVRPEHSDAVRTAATEQLTPDKEHQRLVQPEKWMKPLFRTFNRPVREFG